MNSLWYKLLSICIPFLPQYPETLEALRIGYVHKQMFDICVCTAGVYVKVTAPSLFINLKGGDKNGNLERCEQ